MGIAAEKLGRADRERLAKELFTVTKTEKNGDELWGLCPIHNERNPSFSYNVEKDVYSCLSCGAAGDLVDLFCHVRGYALGSKEGFKAFCEYMGLGRDDNSPINRGEPKPKSSSPQSSSKKLKYVPEEEFQALPPLPDDWVKQCRERFGWTDEVIKRFDLRLFEGNEKDKTGQFKHHKRIAIPIRDDLGRLYNIRKYLPNAKENHNKVTSWYVVLDKDSNKYQTFGQTRLFPDPSKWEPNRPIILCEGEKDTLCALSHGLNAVTQTVGCEGKISQFAQRFKGKDVIIAYDADKPGQSGAEARAVELAEAANSVRIINWPDFMGMAEKHGKDLSDFFMEFDKSVADFNDLLAKARIVEKSEPEEISNSPRRFFGGKNGTRFMPALLAEEIIKDIEILHDPETEITYRWNGKHWEVYNLAFIRRKAIQMLGTEASSPRANDVANLVRDIATLESGRKMNDQKDWICLKNGMYNPLTDEIKPHAKDYYSTFILNVEYTPRNRPSVDLWESFLIKSIGDGHVIFEIRKFFGYCLIQSTKYEKCLILIGPGGDGKSTLLNILQEIIGYENCSNVSLGKLENEFYQANLYNKFLNVSTETETKVFSSDILKLVVSGDRLTTSFKFKNAFEFRPFCKMAFSCNKHPRTTDNSLGFYRRLIIVEMKERFVTKGKADLDLNKKLLAEMPGIFAWAVEGLKDLLRDGFIDNTALQENLLEYQRANNPVLGFKEECLEIAAAEDDLVNWRENKKTVYERYRAYCRQWGHPYPLAGNQFCKELFSLIPTLKTGKSKASNRENCFIGIRLNDECVLKDRQDKEDGTSY